MAREESTEFDLLADEIYASLRQHVLIARLAPGGGSMFAILKMRQALSAARYTPLLFDLRTLEIGTTHTLSTVQIDDHLTSFGPGSEAFVWLNRMWLPSFFAMWDEDYRHRLAGLQGKTPEEVRIGYFGDLRLIRHDIIHKGGRVVDSRRERCSVLKWFDRDDQVEIGPDQYRDLFDLFPWDDLGSSTPRPDPPGPVDTSLSSDGMTMLRQFGSRQNPWS